MRHIRTFIKIIMLIVLTIQSTLFVSAGDRTDISNIKFSHYSVNEGLSQGTVLSCCQDSLGHMWFATHDGLNRYDGYEFTVYRNNPQDSTTIASNVIRKVYCDSQGRVWIGTDKGLSRYDIRSDTFSNFKTDGKIVTGIAEITNEGKLMIIAGGGVKFFDMGKQIWSIAPPCNLNSNFGATILYKNDSDIWIGTMQEGLFRYDIASNDLKKISYYASRLPILCMINHKDDLWVATEGDGLICVDVRNGKIKRHYKASDESLSSNYVRTLSTDMKGRLWIGTFNGLDVIENDRFINIKSNPFTPGSLSQPSVRCIARDNQGGMWLGTWYGGINYWHPLRNSFRNIQRSISGDSLNDDIISCIEEDSDGSLWIGTKSGGLNHYHSKTEKFEYFSPKKSPHHEKIESNDIKAIYIDKDRGYVYFGAHAGGISIINKKNRSISNYPCSNTEGIPMDVYSIIPADENHLWIGSLEGLKKFDKLTKTQVDIEYDCEGDPIRIQKIKILTIDSKGRLWMGGEDGMACYFVGPDGLQPFKPSAFNDIESSFTNSIFESSTKTIWLATSNGLYHYDEYENRMFRYSDINGLPSNMIQGIEEDSFGRLWISTDNGLSCFNPFSGSFRNYTVADGLQSNQFNLYAHCRRSNGEMVFGGINGITVFVPESMSDNTFSPQPQICGLSIANMDIRQNDDTGILSENIILTENIRLRHDQNTISIKVSVPNYISGQNNTFAYILEGYDKEWNESRSRTISYSNLPDGKYRLLIKAANNDGKWNEIPRILNIRIDPIWYKTILAKITIFILLIAVIILFYVLIVRRQEEEREKELQKQEKAHQEELHQMKMRFFINISHEMRTPLTLIINPLQEMIGKSSDTWMRKQLKYVERNAKRLMHLVNQLMDYRRAELGVFKLKIRPENVHKIIKENWAYYEKLAQSKGIRYSLLSDLDGKTLNLDGQYLELILNNLLSNAFKYTDNGSITVRATQISKDFILEVCDTGKGIPEGQQSSIFDRFYQVDNEHIGSGIGLSLVQRLVELHHGKVSLDSTEGKGSTFTVTLPLSLETYSAEETADVNRETHTSNSIEYYLLDTENQSEIEEKTADGKKGRIIIAEDNEEIRTYMNNGLSSLYDIVLAKNGEEALQMAKENQPDIIITDMMMPVMDGLKLCSSLKQDLSTSHIPVIMLSAKTEKEDELNALKSGVDDFMGKPFSMTILKAKIANILRTQYRLQNKVNKSMEISPEKISFNAMDEAFLQKAINIVERNLDNSEFSTEEFAEDMHMSRSNLHIRLKALTGESALDFIRKIRFKEACRLLKDGRYSVSEISDMVGFNTPSYFATCFKKYMGCLPTEYVKKAAASSEAAAN